MGGIILKIILIIILFGVCIFIYSRYSDELLEIYESLKNILQDLYYSLKNLFSDINATTKKIKIKDLLTPPTRR